jgi:hypothetical protein
MSSSSQSLLTSMRRHLPKATHGHLDTLSEWGRFRTAKKFERELQQQQQQQQQQHSHLYGRMGPSGGGGSSNSSVFRVQVPARLVVVALAVFLVVPVSIFGWKETHWKVPKDNQDLHHQHVRGGGHGDKDSYDPQWMEHNLYKKERQEDPDQGERQSPASPTAAEGGGGLSSGDANAAANAAATGTNSTGSSGSSAEDPAAAPPGHGAGSNSKNNEIGELKENGALGAGWKEEGSLAAPGGAAAAASGEGEGAGPADNGTEGRQDRPPGPA